MAYILASERSPDTGVDVYIVTESGAKGVARFWDVAGHWLTSDEGVLTNDIVKKWKYAHAISSNEGGY